jgi:hypothetical protein
VKVVQQLGTYIITVPTHSATLAGATTRKTVRVRYNRCSPTKLAPPSTLCFCRKNGQEGGDISKRNYVPNDNVGALLRTAMLSIPCLDQSDGERSADTHPVGASLDAAGLGCSSATMHHLITYIPRVETHLDPGRERRSGSRASSSSPPDTLSCAAFRATWNSSEKVDRVDNGSLHRPTPVAGNYCSTV